MRLEKRDPGLLSPRPGAGTFRQLAQAGQGQEQSVLGHRAGVAPLGAGPRDPARLRASEYARFEEALDAGHGQLHPPYARVGAKSVEHPVHREAVPHEGVSRLAIASDHFSAALDAPPRRHTQGAMARGPLAAGAAITKRAGGGAGVPNGPGFPRPRSRRQRLI